MGLWDWAREQVGPWASPTTVDILLAGQSNCTPEGLSPRTGVKLPRRDITYSKDFEKASGPVRETQDSGALTYAREAVLQDYLGSALMADLVDTDRINATLITAGRTGCGFMTGNPGSADLWIPPSSNAGVGGTIYDRAVAVWNTNDRSAGLNVVIWCHGETDALSPDGSTSYETNLGNLVDDFLADCDGMTTSNTIFLVVQLPVEYDDGTDGSRRTAVRNEMTAVAAARSYVTLIDVDGEGLQVDDIHYSAALCDALITAVRNATKTELGLL